MRYAAERLGMVPVVVAGNGRRGHFGNGASCGTISNGLGEWLYLVPPLSGFTPVVAFVLFTGYECSPVP